MSLDNSTNSWIVVLEGPHKVLTDRRIPNDLGAILAVLEPYRDGITGIALESTFNWYWLADGLMETGYRVHLVNTCAAKQYEGKKYRDDRHDARWLAHMLAVGLLPEGYICPREDRLVRDLLRRRSLLVRSRTALLLSLRGSIERLTGTRISASHIKRWTGENLEGLIPDTTAIVGLKALLAPVHALTEQIRVLEKEVLLQARQREEYVFLRSVWGVGPVLGMIILYESGDVRRFAKVGNYTSYCRLVGSTKLSNNKIKGTGNRKNGNPYLSWAFSEAATFARRYHEEARRFYRKKRARTKEIVAMRALAHKLARASYYVMRDKVIFDPGKVFC